MNLITDPLGKHGLSFFVATIIPFIFIMIFMMKAKKIAVDMSGEFGEIAVKAGSAVGGLALGAATGGAAFAMRGTIGALGSSIANSKTLARMEARGVPMVRGLRTIGTGASKASFDIRNTKAGSAATSSMGVNAGKGKTGGYKQAEENKIAKRTQRLEELKKVATHENEVNKRKTEVNKKLLEDKNSHDIHQIEADLAIQKQNKANAVTGSQEDKDASAEIARLNKKMVGIKLGKRIEGETNEDGTNKYNTDNGKISKLALESIQKEYNDAEGLVSAAKEEINIANNKLADIEKRKNEARIANGGLLTAEQTNNFQAEKTTADSELSVAKNKLKPLEEKSILALNNLAAANKDAINGYGNSIKELTLKGIEIQHHIDKEGNEIAGKYVKAINSNWNKAVNIFSEGDTDRGRDEASDKMLLGMVVKSASGGDHHSSAPAAPIHEGHKEEKKDSGQKGGDAHGHTGGSAH
jgi:hypothetical protein